MHDADLIHPTRDRVWAVDVTVTYAMFVVTETAGEAEQIAEDEADDASTRWDEADYYAHELKKPLKHSGHAVPYGRSCWEDRQITVNEAVELIASHKPVYDTKTRLMPFADTPPPLYPPRIEDYLAAGRRAR